MVTTSLINASTWLTRIIVGPPVFYTPLFNNLELNVNDMHEQTIVANRFDPMQDLPPVNEQKAKKVISARQVGGKWTLHY